MVEPYSSFLLRYWPRDGTAPRLVIEHIQSGQRATFASLPEALAWLEACCAAEEMRERPDDMSPERTSLPTGQ